MGAGAAAVGATVLFVPPAEAATFTVTNLGDSDDGACDAFCSLREAVGYANATPGYDEITFASGLSGSIRLNDGALQLYEGAAIVGPGSGVLSLDGNNLYRILSIDPTVSGTAGDPVRVSGLRFTDGAAGGPGGALASSEASLSLSDTVFEANRSASAGGAVFTTGGTVGILGSSFSGNKSGGSGGAVRITGSVGSEADELEVFVSGSALSGNDAGDYGGGISIAADGDTVIETTTVSGNEAGGGGGGIEVEGTSEEGDLTIERSTFVGNEAGPGGGLESGGYGGGALVTDVDANTVVRNSTFSANSAYYDGGGIHFGYLQNDQTTLILNSTIAGNRAALDPGFVGYFQGGGVSLSDEVDNLEENGPILISSTILSGNAADTGADLGQGPFADGFAVNNSLIESPIGGLIIENPPGSNLLGVDPKLRPLDANGGPTPTRLPAPKSPVIDAGLANGLPADQRGSVRTFDVAKPNRSGDGTDIGAVETLPPCKGKPATIAAVGKTTGTPGSDVIVGSPGDDRINARGGKDVVCGFDGDDSITGAGGKDKLLGQAGRDKLRGGGGRDTLRGGPGRDKLNGGPGMDSERQ